MVKTRRYGMPAKRVSVVVTRRLPEPVEHRLADLFDTRLRDDDSPMTKADLVEAMQTAEVLVPSVTDTIDAGMLAQAGPDLRLIASYGAGVDHIDVASARQRGILVTNTPGVVTEDTADMAMALMLAVTRRIPEGLAIMQHGGWSGWAPTALLGKYEMVKVEHGADLDMDEWKSCTSNAECAEPKKNDWPKDTVQTIVAKSFADSAPAEVMDYLNKRSWTNATVNGVMSWMTDNQATGEDGAKHFLKENEALWMEWVSPEVAEKVKAAL